MKKFILVSTLMAVACGVDTTPTRTIRAISHTSNIVNPFTTPNGLVVCFAADGTTVDFVSGKSGTATGATLYTAGKYGQAFAFGDYTGDIAFANTPPLNVGVGSGLTFSAWVKTTGTGTLGAVMPSTPGNGPIIEFEGGAHLWSHNQGNAPETSAFTNLIDTTRTWHIMQQYNVLPIGQWSHVAVTYDRASGVAVLYTNGIAVETQNFGSFIPITNTTLHIGSRVSSWIDITKEAFDGSIDDASIYNRALTQDEIKGIYLSTTSKCAVPTIPSRTTTTITATGDTVVVVDTSTVVVPVKIDDDDTESHRKKIKKDKDKDTDK